VSAARWAYIARALSLTAPTLPLVTMYARGMTSNTLLPGATVSGDLLRSYELSRLGNPILESTASVAFDRFSGLWTLAYYRSSPPASVSPPVSRCPVPPPDATCCSRTEQCWP